MSASRRAREAVAESPLPSDAEEEGFEGIGVYAESGLHAELKRHLAGPDDAFEVAIEGKIIDLVRQGPAGEELVEVQTKRLDKIAPKVLALAKGHKVRVVHPVPVEILIVRLDPVTGKVLSERKSPKRGDLFSIFDELVRAPSLIAARNVTLEILLVRSRELRTRDGSGSWRRRGDKTLSRDLEEVVSSTVFATRRDWLKLIPRGLEAPWTSQSLGEALGIGADRARKILYSYVRAGLVAELGKDGRRKIYGPAAARRKKG
jgi:hypothetical protein